MFTAIEKQREFFTFKAKIIDFHMQTVTNTKILQKFFNRIFFIFPFMYRSLLLLLVDVKSSRMKTRHNPPKQIQIKSPFPSKRLFKTSLLMPMGSEKHGWQISWHWLAGNFYFPRGRIFIFCFSEPLGINMRVQ